MIDNTPGCHVLDLPDELLIMILDLVALDPDSFQGIWATCRRFYAVIPPGMIRAHNACKSILVTTPKVSHRGHIESRALKHLKWPDPGFPVSVRSLLLRYLKRVSLTPNSDICTGGDLDGNHRELQHLDQIVRPCFMASRADTRANELTSSQAYHMTDRRGVDPPSDNPYFGLELLMPGLLPNLESLMLGPRYSSYEDLEILSHLIEQRAGLSKLKELVCSGNWDMTPVIVGRLLSSESLETLVLESTDDTLDQGNHRPVPADAFKKYSGLQRLALMKLDWRVDRLAGLLQHLPELRCFCWVQEDHPFPRSADDNIEDSSSRASSLTKILLNAIDGPPVFTDQATGTGAAAADSVPGFEFDINCVTDADLPVIVERYGMCEDRFQPVVLLRTLFAFHGHTLRQLSLCQRQVYTEDTRQCDKIVHFRGFSNLAYLEIYLGYIRQKKYATGPRDLPPLAQILPSSIQELSLDQTGDIALNEYVGALARSRPLVPDLRRVIMYEPNMVPCGTESRHEFGWRGSYVLASHALSATGIELEHEENPDCGCGAMWEDNKLGFMLGWEGQRVIVYDKDGWGTPDYATDTRPTA